jgi:hypothetical protein
MTTRTKFSKGDFVVFARGPRLAWHDNGVVEKATSKEVAVRFWAVGYGRDPWPFSAAGARIGKTKEVFPTGHLLRTHYRRVRRTVHARAR